MSRRIGRGMLRALFAGTAAAALALTGTVSAAAEEPTTTTITGTVTTEADGTPVENVGVFVSSTGGGFSYNGYTDANGDYTVTDLPAGEYVVHFSPVPGSGLDDEYWDNAAQWFSADRIQTAGGETITDIDAALAAPPLPGSISGTVTREDGTPVAGVTINASATGPGWGWGTTTTGADGTYTIPSLPVGSYTIAFRPDGTDLAGEYWDDATIWSAATPVGLTSGATVTGIDAELAVGGEISGSVTDAANGAPVAGVTVEVLAENGGIVAQVQSDEGGTYEVGGLATGSYRVRFTSHVDPSLAAEYWENARTQSAATAIAVTAGQSVGSIDAALETVGHLSGSVTRASDGTPFTGASIIILDAVTSDYAGSGWVQSDGAFDVAVAPGTYTVQFSSWESGILPEYWDDARTAGQATPVTVVSGEVVSGMDVQMDAAAVISGVVSLASDEDREVIVEAYDGKTLVGSAHASLEDGSYQLYVPAGTYTLKASAIFYNGSTTFVKPQWSGGAKQQKKATPVTVTVDQPVSGIDFTLIPKTGE